LTERSKAIIVLKRELLLNGCQEEAIIELFLSMMGQRLKMEASAILSTWTPFTIATSLPTTSFQKSEAERASKN
jgi:hypothetical protein